MTSWPFLVDTSSSISPTFRQLGILSHRINSFHIRSEDMLEEQAPSLVSKLARSEPTASKKRKMTVTSTPKRKGTVVDLTQEDETQTYYPLGKKMKGASSHKAKDEEKRLRRFRPHPPQSYLERLNRATTQR